MYHRKNDPNNKDNHIEVFLYPGAPPGNWTVRLFGDYVISGRFHAWIERDLACPGAQSRFDARITSQSYTLGTIATSPLVITVGAYDANAEERPLAPFSSCGPTRDERRDKPELLAPGVGVVGARSISRGAVRQEGLLVARSGTSMAAPHVAGTVAALLEAAGRPVSIDEIRDCLKHSAEPVLNAEHANCCAWGRLNAAGAIRRIRDLKGSDWVSALRGNLFAADAPVMTSELAISDADTGEFSGALVEQGTEACLDQGVLRHMDQIESYSDNPPEPFEDGPVPAAHSASDVEVINVDPDSEEHESDRVEAVEALEAKSSTRPLRVRARILWPALGFPAVISPQSNGSTDALEAKPSRSIVALIISDQRYLGKEDVAHYLRIVPWSQRGRRHIPDGQPGSFRVEDVQVRNDDRGKVLQWPQSDTHGQAVVFGGGLRQGQDPDDDAIVVSLSRMVLDFYRRQGLEHLHEIRISEAAAARLTGDQYHLFWNDDVENPAAPSGEMQLLLNQFARPNRADLAPEWRKHLAFFLDEYKFDYGALHAPYQRSDRQKRLTEVLHPVFVRRWSKPLNIAHMTDTHVDVRADVYEENLAKSNEFAGISFNNYNKDFIEIYRESRANADLILLTGDLIDYGRGHVGLSFNGSYRHTLGQDGAYHRDRNWMLFYYLLASDDNYTKPAYTCLGNHDWRLNPYPPFAPGTPDPESLAHNADNFRKKPGVLKELIKVAHGPGHEKGFAYALDAETKLGLLFKEPIAALRGLANKLDTDGSPVQTKVESVAWYLMLINPFLDYSIKLPSSQQLLMLDWAEDEEVMNFDEPRSFMEFGQRAAKALTALQKWHVDEFARQPGKAKIIGIHAPPIGPYFLWEDSDLLKGVKKYAPGVNSVTYDANWKRVKMTEHTLFAIRPKNAPRGIEAAYGSFNQARDWFIQRVADQAAGIRLVLSGHIHRNGLVVVRTPAVKPKVWIIRGVNYHRARGALPPRVGSSEPDVNGQAIAYFGPLYVNTTSSGPRGHEYQDGHKYVSPGYAVITLASDGTIVNVSPRQIVPAAASPHRTPVAAGESELVSSSRGDVVAPEAAVTTFDLGFSGAAGGDFTSASEEQETAASLGEGALMNADVADRSLDRAEHAVRSSYGGRRESETSFLQRLLGELGAHVPAAGLSPAELFRAVLCDRHFVPDALDVVEVLAKPSQRPESPLRPGDWMLRAVPGTGDVGHVSVLASDNLLPLSTLAAECIPSEGVLPGYYGLVIEAGIFPHSRSQPFARRWLDSHGRVPPHTVVLRPKYSDPASMAHFPPDEAEQEEVQRAVDTEDLDWEDTVFRAIFGGERRINALLKIGRETGGPNDNAIRRAVLKFLRVPFPQGAQPGGIKCEQHVRILAPPKPDTPRIIFTGRYESKNQTGDRFFWAINQAGNTVIAIRTMRGFGPASRDYWELRGDIQDDGTAVLFQTDKPNKFWGYLQLQPDRSIRWYDSSYLGANGKRVQVDANLARDEVLQLSSDNRPTLMESLYKSDDNYLSVLLQQREWYPLTATRYEFLQEGARSDLLRVLLVDYLKIHRVGITSKEKQDRQVAAQKIVNYMAHLLWNGVAGTKPDILALQPALKAHGERARRLFPNGHHNNAVLATHVAKIWLAQIKQNHEGEKRSFLDWLTMLVQERQERTLSRLLDVPLNPGRSAATHRYRLKLEVATPGFLLAEGNLQVEKLTSPKWPGKGSLRFDVTAGILGKPRFPAREEVFDLVVTTPQEWMPDDFEGTLWLGEVTASVGIKSVKPGATLMGGWLRSKNGLWIALEDGDVFVKPGSPGGKQGKPKFKFRAEAMVGSVRRHAPTLIDLSNPFPASRKVTGNLVSATHFCLGSSLLMPAARQLLRVVCADRLALLDNPTSQIFIIGHTDRLDTDTRNQELSVLRAKNIKTALSDILGDKLRVPPDAVHALGFGEWLARFKLHPDRVRNPDDRRVDILINGSLVATFRG
jgi:outer membrane protein OmpA-like peptidoglycan-associated protein